MSVVQWRLLGIQRPSIAKIHSFTCNFNFASDLFASMKKELDRFCETTSLSFRKMSNHNAVLDNCNRILAKFMFWFQSSFEKFSILRFTYCHIREMPVTYFSDKDMKIYVLALLIKISITHGIL